MIEEKEEEKEARAERERRRGCKKEKSSTLQPG